ncbi:MAG: hypothetical protein RLY93_11030 [Sumerlaeia bacterium]
MPHVVIRGPVSAEDIWLAFQPLEFQEGGNVMKVADCYLSSDREVLLLRATVVERGFPKNFFLKIVEDGDEQTHGEMARLTISVEKQAAPERTDAVKRLIGLSAWRLLQAVPEAEVATTNIPEFIKGPDTEEDE